MSGSSSIAAANYDSGWSGQAGGTTETVQITGGVDVTLSFGAGGSSSGSDGSSATGSNGAMSLGNVNVQPTAQASYNTGQNLRTGTVVGPMFSSGLQPGDSYNADGSINQGGGGGAPDFWAGVSPAAAGAAAGAAFDNTNRHIPNSNDLYNALSFSQYQGAFSAATSGAQVVAWSAAGGLLAPAVGAVMRPAVVFLAHGGATATVTATGALQFEGAVTATGLTAARIVVAGSIVAGRATVWLGSPAGQATIGNIQGFVDQVTDTTGPSVFTNSGGAAGWIYANGQDAAGSIPTIIPHSTPPPPPRIGSGGGNHGTQ